MSRYSPDRGGSAVGCALVALVAAAAFVAGMLVPWYEQPAPSPAPTAQVVQWRATDRPMSCWYVVVPGEGVATWPCLRDFSPEPAP